MNRKTEHLLRRFQNRHNVRSEVVHLLASGQPVEDATPEEQVAVIAVLCINQPFSEVIQRGIDSGEFRQVDAREVAIAGSAIIEGTLLLWVYDKSMIEPEKHIRSGMKLLLEGVQART
ncbi:hypothetical protein FBQ99_14835 [Chloroflexi bacterium CFX2]|nr:hypothetical protein [Chloroflexi bacterium CFX2]